MAYFEKRYNGKWRAQIGSGKARRSKTFSSLARAKAWAAREESEAQDISEGAIPRHTLGEALERYSREVSPRKRGGRWEEIRLAALPDTGGRTLQMSLPLHAVSPAVLAKWRDLRSLEVSPATVLRELGLLSAVFRQCVREWGWMKANPVREIGKPPAPAHRDKVLNRREISGILAELGRTGNTVSGRIGLAFLFALRTGMRAGEICSLKLNQVHGDHVSLPLTKNGTARSVPLSRKAQIVLKRALDGNRDPVFGLKVGSLDTLFRRARERAGLVDIHFHDSRHWAATQMARKLPLLDLCRVFGWKDPRHALIYYNATASDIARLLDKRI